MSTAHPLVAFFKDIDKHDLPLVGGKGANLGEMTQAGFPVPNGFALTVVSYERFLEENNLHEYLHLTLAGIDVNDSHALQLASAKIEKRIMECLFPSDVAEEVVTAYKKLSGFLKKEYVAVRSSATAEDLPGASFAGQQATFLDVKGERDLLEKIKACWASLFTARAIFYRVQNKISHDKVKISVIVQKMVHSDVSGVMFSINPVTNEKDRIVIEAVWGLGEMIVQGAVVPDKYLVQKDTYAILSREVNDQEIMLVRSKGGTEEVKVPNKFAGQRKINDKEVIALAKLAQRLQEHYYFPQDMEWAKEGDKLFITQTRPITTMNIVARARSKDESVDTSAVTPLLTGISASPGIGVGKAKILRSPNEIDKVMKGDVLVAPMTSPDYVPAMKRAAAIVTDQGGLTSHAAIVSRELGVPCIVGTKLATAKIKDGDIITVDGSKGLVYLGGHVAGVAAATAAEKVAKKKLLKKRIKTATKVYVNLAEPERAREIAKRNVDGVGLLRAEFMIANIGIHPKEAIKQKTQGVFIKKLAHDLELFCDAFDPRPVVYRATDFKTNEYRALPGGKIWEPVEPNPLLGFRGAFRYASSPEVFNLELEAIKKVREKYKNLHLMVPFVRSPEELAKIRSLVAASGLFESSTFRFLMMVELPVNVIMLEEFIKVGIDGVSIGSNDLTMLLLGTDRDNAEVAQAFNERSPAVDWALKRTIDLCNKHGITSSICGQAPSTYEDLVEKLVQWGVTGMSVNPDAIERVRSVVSRVEKEIIK